MDDQESPKSIKGKTQRRRDKAIALIKIRPGITPQSLATHLGIAYKFIDSRGQFRTSLAISELIDWLRSYEGVHVLEPDKLHGSIRLYSEGSQPPVKRLFQPARERSLGECKTYKVPLAELHQYTQSAAISVKPTIAPTAQRVNTKAIAAELEPINPPTPKQEKDMAIPARRTTESVRAAIEDALTELLAEEKPFTQQDVCKRASIGLSTLHRHKDLLDKVRSTISAIRFPPAERGLPARISSLSTFALQQQIQDLEQRNRDLRQQLQKVQEQVAPSMPLPSLSLRLQEEVNFWQEQICQHEKQREKIELAIAKAQAKVEVLNDLIQREQVQVHAEGNGICKAVL